MKFALALVTALALTATPVSAEGMFRLNLSAPLLMGSGGSGPVVVDPDDGDGEGGGEGEVIQAVVGGSVPGADASAFFSASDWASDSPKKLVVSEDAVVGATSTSSAALVVAAGFGGELTVEIRGSVLGKGGGPGQAGGPAIEARAPVRVVVSGSLMGGGGGGGQGGQGGLGGEYVEFGEWTDWKFDQNSATRHRCEYRSGWTREWNGKRVNLGLNADGYFYECSSEKKTESNGGRNYTTAIRRAPATAAYRAGGDGGLGGTGSGFGTEATQGEPGAESQDGAGRGGTGGVGGDWGRPGQPGGRGDAGSMGGGQDGLPGGAAGPAIVGASKVTLVNSGRVEGPLVN
jgi:hypothetical protein